MALIDDYSAADNYTRPARCQVKEKQQYYSGNFCLTLPISVHGSAFRYFFELRMVNWLPAVVRGSASHVTGMEIGAPARARVE
jgi:hypothetical protein